MNLAHGASLTPGPASPSPADLGLIASSFASFAEIMTGFSFAALAIYLAYESSKGKHADNDETHTIQVGEDSPDAKDWRNTKQGGRQRNPVEVAAHHEVRRSDVAAALFYSMASLAISSFLYASLTSGVEDPSKIAAAILLYGVLFGTSTLTFFYALTLMTYGNSYTRDAARAAYRVLVIFGPAVVSRFL
ncbi:MAG: hypothetical protein J2P29_17650, partial [Actinobacteria bacterium]|nr:hypothetical protein [Actinomycetota bacterium]